MKKIKAFALGLGVAVLALAWFTFTRHVIRTPEGMRVVKRVENGFQNSYVDVRAWGFLDYAAHPEVGKALAVDELERAKARGEAAANELEQKLGKAIDGSFHELEGKFKQK
ncbi:MAG: hypothetical protein HYZ53_18655 [Planctomycetes bacterium]|nr:hypothetical protein [Planctomycetota bacterium]